MTDQELRVEALRIIASIEGATGTFKDLLAMTQIVYEWLRTGKNPVIKESD